MKISIATITLFFTLFSSSLLSAQGDTTIVQTYTFEEQNDPLTAYDSPGRRWFTFPEDDGTTYQKILMYYTLKCFEDGTAGNLGFPCGEWDYTTHTYMYEHTGNLDSLLSTHPFYLANNQGFDTLLVGNTPYAHQYQYPLMMTNVEEVIEETVFDSDLGDDEGVQTPFGTGTNRGRTQMLWLASELTDLGVQAGEINGIDFEINSMGGELEELKIRLAETNVDELEHIHELDFEEVYAWNTTIDELGYYHFHFATPFSWDGTSNILVDVSHNNEVAYAASMVTGGPAGFSATVTANEDANKYMHLNWYDEVKVPAEAFENIDEQVTIAFWLNGDEDIQPQSSTIFEGVNANNQRVLNSHCPWENSRVYWDAGWDGGYDRIDKLAAASQFEGEWSHWAFTKNTVSGEMKIYHNGSLWHSGVDKDNPMSGIVEFSIGAARSWTNYYNGHIDEFTLWNVELDEETISEWMYSDVTAAHPNYDALQTYYKFNGDNGTAVVDHSPNGLDGEVHGSPNRVAFRGDEHFKTSITTTDRPNVKFYQGTYTVSIETDITTWSVPEPPVAITEWEAVGNDVVLISSEYQWPDGWAYVYDVDGILIDSLEYAANVQYINQDFEYYQAPYEVINTFELGRFITPYGINLTLDDDGWTWVYDVTDYAPFLKDSVELAAGNWQELLDLKFAFIEGTPPRDVARVETLWGGQWNLSTWQETVQPVTVTTEPGEEMFKIKTRASGHWFGQGNNCAEFCFNTHSLAIDGDEEYSWEIMQECADNPLYPQGGTWIYDRAAWCPGMPVTTQNLEVTEFVDGDSFDVDYNVTYDPYGNYVFHGQVVTYGGYNFQNDVEIHDIIAPSNRKIMSRMNPMCDNPVVEIRNNGEQPLTSCTISFGIGGVMDTYEWTGSLGFLETERVELTYSDVSMWLGDEEEVLVFTAEVSAPNGVTDENEFNNVGTSTFIRPPLYTYGEGDEDDNRLIIWLKTNNAYWETWYTLSDIDGNTVYERNDFSEANVNYRDTIQVNEGCYLFHLKDTQDDGLNFFANNDGSGTMRLKQVGGPILKNFEPDFGKEIKHYFYWKTDLVSVEDIQAKTHSLVAYPNPSNGIFNLRIDGFAQNLDLSVYSIEGRLVKQQSFLNPGGQLLKPIDLSDLPDGMYQLVLSDGLQTATSKILKN